jgi:type I restriction enzyme S subunit
MERYITDIVEFTGKRPEPFEGMKKYISTGALILSNIDNNAVELIEYYSRPSRADLEVKPGDLVFAKMSNTDKRLIINEETSKYIYSTGFFAVKAKQGVITTKCLYYLLGSKNFLDQKDKNSTGATQRAITIDGLSKIKVRIPDYISQKNIEIILELLDEIVKLRKNQINEYDQLIKSRFVEIFGTLSSTIFETKQLNELSELITDGTHQTPKYTDDSTNGYKFLSSKDVTSGRIDWTNIKYIPEDLHKQLYSRLAPKRNDILLAKNGTTGTAAIVDVDEVFDIYVSLALIRFKEGIINPYYALYAINSIDTKRQFDSSLKGVGVPNLHLGEIRKVKIIFPPMQLQNEFVKFVNQIDKLKFTVQKSLEETQTLFDSLMQKYFG